MKAVHRFAAVLMGAGVFAWDAPSARAQPNPGQWIIAVSLKGLPMTIAPNESTRCLSAEKLAAGPEMAFVEAGLRSPTNKESMMLSCTLSHVQRALPTIAWQSSCETPQGKVSGSGTGQFSSTAVEIRQTLEAKTPMGQRTVVQTITAKYAGECK